MTPLQAFVAASLALLMTVIAVIDWRHYRVPDVLCAAALALRVFDMALEEPAGRVDAFTQAGVRAATMAALFYLFRAGYRALRGRDGLGLGDVKLAAVAGAWVDWRLLPFVVEFAALAGLALALARAARGSALRRDMKLPFAVGFAPAIFVGWQMENFGF